MLNPKQKSEIKKLVKDFIDQDGWSRSEENIQSLYTIKLLNILGYQAKNLRINEGQEVATGKKPDILLFDDSKNTLMVIESKEASKRNVLDGRYQNQTFVEQLYGYCKAEGIAWGILTNFIEWRVYSVYQNRLYKSKRYCFSELLKDAPSKEFTDIFSHEGLNFLERLSKKNLVQEKGRWDSDPVYYPEQEQIKEKFFLDLQNWRERLRRFLVSKYSKQYELTKIDLMTQIILDRLIFIDYCSDNGIISQDRLHAILEAKGNLNNELQNIFRDMDERFNSELFAPNECDKLEIDDSVLQPVISELSNTDFSKLSVNVIGEVYESYLGELLRSSGKRKTDEDSSLASKKKKVQGIYYTPEFVVDFIVENTVGVLLAKCKTAKEIESIRVLDPACGSGSFLIRVFEEFLKHYERLNPSGMFQFETRKKILQHNIYGIDLDERAIEIAKLNLMVKALENTSHATLIGKKILPNLKLNIRCGNSLVSGELVEKDSGLFWQGHAKSLTDLKALHASFHDSGAEDRKVSAYDKLQIIEHSINSHLNQNLSRFFKRSELLLPANFSVIFPDIFGEGGFDCVIGNPPYIDSESMQNNQPETREFVAKFYEMAKGNWDIYIAFFERALKLTKKGGFFAYITPDKWLSKPFGKVWRTESIPFMTHLARIGRKAFADAKVDSIVTIYQKQNSKSIAVADYETGSLEIIQRVPKSTIKSPFTLDYLFSAEGAFLIKIESCLANKVVSFECENACATSDAYKLKPLVRDLGKSTFDPQKYYKVINTGTIGRFAPKWGQKPMVYLKDKYDFPVVKISEFHKEFVNSYGSKAKLPKLIIKSLTLLDAAIDSKGEFIPGKSTLIIPDADLDKLYYLAGVINSRLPLYYIKLKYPASSYNQGINFTKDMINNFPIPDTKPNLRAKITALAKTLNKTDLDKDPMTFAAREHELNELVYELYDLTVAEAKLIDEHYEG